MNYIQGHKMKENEELKPRTTPIAMVAPELKQHDIDTEITRTCAVLGCEDSKTLNSDLFFRFPEEPNLRAIWTDLTGRNNWTPTDYSYICVQHFSVDCFVCDSNNAVVLVEKAVPSLKLPNHVLEVEYIEDETFDNEEEDHVSEDYDMNDVITKDKTHELDHNYEIITNGNAIKDELKSKNCAEDNLEALKLFSEVQNMQKQAVSLKEKLRCSIKVYNRQNRLLMRLKKVMEIKKNMLKQKQRKRSRILLTLQDKIKEDSNGLVLAMPTRHTDDLKNIALSIYKYSPQAYIYVRNALRTLLPSTDVLDGWVTSGYEPRNVLTRNHSVKLATEISETELSTKILLQ